MIFDKFRIDGQVAVVTGGTRGIGKGIALALAEAGASIVAVSRRNEKDVEEKVLHLGRQYMHVSADLSNREQTYKVLPAVLDAMGEVDILVNNSGVCLRSAAADYSHKDWDSTLEINLSACFVLSQAAGEVMLKKGRGKIINVASVLSFQGGVNVLAYAASKHGIAGLTKAFANDWASKGINVNAIAPGYFATALTDDLQKDPKRSESIVSRTPAGRWGQPDELGGAAVFLASSASDFVNGAILPVDGGWLAW